MTAAFSTNLRLVPERIRDTDAERGTIDVPVRHEAPSRQAIPLRFVRLRHRGTGSGTPLVFLSGGPGLSGVQTAAGRLFPLFDALRDHGDVILLDQRACVVDEMVLRRDRPRFHSDRVVSRDEYLHLITSTVGRDLDQLAASAIDPHALHTNQSADDVALIARTLYGNNARMALLGWSYGSHLAMAIMKRHESMLHRVVLAAPEGPDHTLKLPSRVQQHLEALSRRAGSDLVGMLSRALDRMDVEPAIVPMPADESGDMPVALGRFDLQWTISELAADTRALRRLPGWLAKMERGDFQVLGSERLLRGAWEALREELPHSAVRYCFDCASGATAARLQRIRDESRRTLLGNVIDFPAPDVGDALGSIDLGDGFRSAPESTVPVMFITGTLDCRTPSPNVDELAPGLPDHRHLVVNDAGHGDLLLPSAVHAAIHRFIGGGEPEALAVRAGTPFAFEQ